MLRYFVLSLILLSVFSPLKADENTIDTKPLKDIPHLADVMMSVYGIDIFSDQDEVRLLSNEELATALQMATMWNVPISNDSISYEKVQSCVNDILKAYSLRKTLISRYNNTFPHEVVRGENWESIAEKYDIFVSNLKAANPNSVCATGMILEVPTDLSIYAVNERDKENRNSDYATAKDYMLREEYKKAIKVYTQIIENSDAAVSAYYNRGRAWFNRGKMRQAMADFQYVVNHDSDNLYADASEMHDKASSIQKERDEARRQMLDNLGTVGQNMLQGLGEYSQMRMQSAMGYSGGYMPSSNSVASVDYSSMPTLNSMLPDALRPEVIAAKAGEPQYSYDANGNLMVAWPGMAQAMRDMSQESMKAAQNYAMNSGGSSYSRAMSNATLQMAVWNSQMTESNAYWMETPTYVSAYADAAGSSSGDESISISSGSTFDYQSTYNSYERRAEDTYNSLTMLGSRTTDSSGDISGSIGSRGNHGGSSVSMKMSLSQIQKEMVRVRNEAAAAGITITPSKWETATVSLAY